MWWKQALIAIISVIGVIAYRVSVLAALQLMPVSDNNSSDITTVTADLVYENASLVTTITAATINLIIIIILNYVSTVLVSLFNLTRLPVWLFY